MLEQKLTMLTIQVAAQKLERDKTCRGGSRGVVCNGARKKRFERNAAPAAAGQSQQRHILAQLADPLGNRGEGAGAPQSQAAAPVAPSQEQQQSEDWCACRDNKQPLPPPPLPPPYLSMPPRLSLLPPPLQLLL